MEALLNLQRLAAEEDDLDPNQFEDSAKCVLTGSCVK